MGFFYGQDTTLWDKVSHTNNFSGGQMPRPEFNKGTNGEKSIDACIVYPYWATFEKPQFW